MTKIEVKYVYKYSKLNSAPNLQNHLYIKIEIAFNAANNLKSKMFFCQYIINVIFPHNPYKRFNFTLIINLSLQTKCALNVLK